VQALISLLFVLVMFVICRRAALRRLAVVAFVAMVAACVSTDDPHATFSAVRVYPMGAGQFMITCVDSPGYCARQATRSCPSGFDVVSNTTNPADYGRMTMIVKCH
jgi:hypothetical protein